MAFKLAQLSCNRLEANDVQTYTNIPPTEQKNIKTTTNKAKDTVKSRMTNAETNL